MEQLSFKQSFKPFFGNSEAASTFVAANYAGSGYTQPVNEQARPELLDNTMAANVMFVKNYINASAGGPEDLHNEYVDFIVRTALFHRELDYPTDVGSGMGEIRKVLNDASTAALRETWRNIKTVIRAPLPSLRAMLNDSDSLVQVLNAVSIAAVQSGSVLSDKGSLLNAQVDGKYVRNILKDLANCDKTSGSNYCYGAYLNPGSGKSISDVIQQISAGSGVTLDRAIRDSVMYGFADIAADHMFNTLQSEAGGILAVTAALASGGADEILNRLKRLNDGQLQNLNAALVQHIYDSIKSIVKAGTSGFYKDMSYGGAPDEFFQNIFGNWEKLDSEAREFYREHVHVFKRDGDNWIDLMKNGFDFNPRGIALNPANLRINLMKSSKGSDMTLFNHTLPWIKVGTKINVTEASGAIKIVSATDAGDLRNIYKCVYNGTRCDVGGTVLNLPANFALVKSNKNDFNLDPTKILKNHIVRKSVAETSNASLDELFTDLASGEIYRSDAKGLYREDSRGNKIYADEENVTDNCIGTGLTSQNCRTFVRDCILSEDPEQLSKCLDSLKDKNMFLVAHEELRPHPNAAIKVLNTFGVQRVKVNGIEVPETYESWRANVLGTFKHDVKNAIIGNENLNTYLKGVIDFVARNPAILNKGLNSNMNIGANAVNDRMLTALEKTSYYTHPLPLSSQGKAFGSELFVKSVSSPMFGISLPGSMITSPFANGVIGGVLAPYNMIGGGRLEESALRKINKSSVSSQIFHVLLNGVIEDLKSAGIALNERDLARLENGIKTLGTTEKRLGELFLMLRQLSELATFYRKVSGCSPSTTVPKTVSIAGIRSNQDALNYLEKNIGDLQNCISGNLTQQNSICAEMSSHIGALLDTSAGKSHPDIVNA